MVLDTSAIMAILLDEPERERFNRLIAASPVRLVSTATRVEAMLVIESRKGAPGRIDLERFLHEAQIEHVAFTSDQADIACEAFRRFGKGRHPAGLNLGDCFAYALARASFEPLLCKGDDFSQTDIAVADEPV